MKSLYWKLPPRSFMVERCQCLLSMLQRTGWLSFRDYCNRWLKSWSQSSLPFWKPFSSVQSLSCVRLFATPWIAACQASLSITNSWSLRKLMSIESVMPSSHLILCHPLLLLHPIPPSIRFFSNESALRIRWPVLECQLEHQSFQWTPRTDFL